MLLTFWRILTFFIKRGWKMPETALSCSKRYFLSGSSRRIGIDLSVWVVYSFLLALFLKQICGCICASLLKYKKYEFILKNHKSLLFKLLTINKKFSFIIRVWKSLTVYWWGKVRRNHTGVLFQVTLYFGCYITINSLHI